MNKVAFQRAPMGAGIAGLAFTAGCGPRHSTPVSAPAPAPASTPATVAAAPPVQAGAFQPYTLIDQPAPLPLATTHRHRRLLIVTVRRRVYLADGYGHDYNAGRDDQGHLYPIYQDPVTNRAYPLYYDQDHDDYYRMIRTDSGDYYRNYVGTEGNDYYRVYNPAPGTPAAEAENYNPYSPPLACLPQVYQPDGSLYAPQPAGYSDSEPDVHHSHGDQDLWLLAIPVVIGAYLLLNQHHHSSGGGGPVYAPPAGYYGGYRHLPPPQNPPASYNSNALTYTRNVSTTIINNNNQRITNIYTVSPPPEAIARQPEQGQAARLFGGHPPDARQFGAGRPIVHPAPPQPRFYAEPARVRPNSAPQATHMRQAAGFLPPSRAAYRPTAPLVSSPHSVAAVTLSRKEAKIGAAISRPNAAPHTARFTAVPIEPQRHAAKPAGRYKPLLFSTRPRVSSEPLSRTPVQPRQPSLAVKPLSPAKAIPQEPQPIERVQERRHAATAAPGAPHAQQQQKTPSRETPPAAIGKEHSQRQNHVGGNPRRLLTKSDRSYQTPLVSPRFGHSVDRDQSYGGAIKPPTQPGDKPR